MKASSISGELYLMNLNVKYCNVSNKFKCTSLSYFILVNLTTIFIITYIGVFIHCHFIFILGLLLCNSL